MSRSELDRLLGAASGDEGLREGLKRVTSDAELIELAGARGYDAGADDVASLHQELTDEQLESVAGGFSSNHTGGANFCMGDGSVHFLLPYMEQQNLYDGK